MVYFNNFRYFLNQYQIQTLSSRALKALKVDTFIRQSFHLMIKVFKVCFGKRLKNQLSATFTSLLINF